MKSESLIDRMAKQGQPKPDAADQLDRAVETILKHLRKGEPVALPGIGQLVPERRQLRFVPAPHRRTEGYGRR